MEDKHGFQQVFSVVSNHLFRQSLLSYAPQCTLVAILHKHVELTLQGRRGRREEGGEGGEKRKEGRKEGRKEEGRERGGGSKVSRRERWWRKVKGRRGEGRRKVF